MTFKNNLSTLTLCGIAFLLAASPISAKTITLYESANDAAKKIGAIDLATGVIPIFQPKGSSWVKVADPNNGNVGWVKTEELNQSGTTSFSFKQRVLDNDNQSYNTQVFEFGSDNQATNKDPNKTLQEMQKRQREIQDSLSKTIQTMVNELNEVYKTQGSAVYDTPFPIIMPVLVVPTPAQSTKSQTTTKPQPPTKP